MFFKRIIGKALIVMALASSASFAWLDEKLPDIPRKVDGRDAIVFGYGASILEDVNGDKAVWFTTRLSPSFRFNDTHIGLTLPAYIDGNGRIRKSDWDTADDIIDKLDFLWYGTSTSKKHFRVGELKSLTLGEGMLVRRFANRPLYPLGHKAQGLEGGIVTRHRDLLSFFVDDITRPALMGARMDFDTWEFAKISFDIISDRGLNSESPAAKNITAYGAEISSRVWGNGQSSMAVYQNIARYSTGDAGWSTGLRVYSGNIFARTEYRYHNTGFMPGYFGYDYSQQRVWQEAWMRADTTVDRHSSMRLELGYDDLSNLKIFGSVERVSSFDNKYHADIIWGPEIKNAGKLTLKAGWDSAVLPGMTERTSSYDASLTLAISEGAGLSFTSKRMLDVNRRSTAVAGMETTITF